MAWPSVTSITAVGRTPAGRRLSLRHQVHEARRADHHPGDLLTIERPPDAFGRQGGVPARRLVGVGTDRQAVPDPPVDLHDQDDLLLPDQALIPGWPRTEDDRLGVSES